jgi:alpha-mannosidase
LGNWRLRWRWDAEVPGFSFIELLKIRQALYARGYFRDKLGLDATLSWALDTFGYHARPGPDGGTVLRVYEASGQSTPWVKIGLQAKMESAFEANLIEQPASKLKVKGNGLQFDLGPFQIKTFQLQLSALQTRP